MADIFSTDPYGRQVNRPGLFKSIMGSANSTMDLFNKGYQNQQEAAKAQYAQNTLGDSIAAANAKNQADAQYYPQQQMYKTQQEEQTVKEIMARTGLTYAQAKEAAAQTGLINTQQQVLANPFTQTHNMIQQWQQLPTDSHEKIMLGSLLDGGAAGQMFPSKGSTGSKPMTGTFPGLGAPGWVRDQRFGPTRGGGGGTYTDPNTGQMVSTDTTASTTQDQATTGAVQRVAPLIEDIRQKQSKFLTLGGQSALYKARLGNFAFGGESPLPTEYATAQADTELAAEGLIKAYGLKVTDQSLNMVKSAIKPLMGENPGFYNARMLNTLNAIKKNQGEAEQRLNSGIPVGQTATSPAQYGYFTRNSVSDPGILGTQQQTQEAAQPSTPQQAIQIPQFNNPDEFRAWFQLQSPDMQAQIAAQLPKKGQ